MITRTIKTTHAELMTANVSNGTIEYITVDILNHDFTNFTESDYKAIEKYVKKNNLLDSNHVFVKVNTLGLTEEKYGITEEDFMAHAVKLEK